MTESDRTESTQGALAGQHDRFGALVEVRYRRLAEINSSAPTSAKP
jgi:hypothetical protein